MCVRTPGTKIELRTARIGPSPKLPPLCPTTSPPASHHPTSLPAPSQNSCRSWPWLQQPQSQCGDHRAVPYVGTKPWSRGTLSAQPCPATGTRTSQCPGARAMLCWKEPSQGSQQAPQHLGAREVSPGDLEARREIQTHSSALQPVSWLLSICVTAPELLPGATGPSAATGPPVATTGSCGQPQLLLMLTAACMWGLASACPWSPARARPHPMCHGGDCKPCWGALRCMGAQPRSSQQSGRSHPCNNRGEERWLHGVAVTEISSILCSRKAGGFGTEAALWHPSSPAVH